MSDLCNINEDSELLDKPTPSAAEIIKKHGMSEQAFVDQMRKGVKSELEHTSNVKVAIEIAMDHLNEYPDYYDRLDRIETNESTDSTQAAKPKGKIAKIHPNFDGPIPSLSTVPELAGAYYGMYRFGVHMAGSPTNAPHEHGPTANHMVTAAYTDAEADIINHSAKSMKMKVKAVTSKGSKEVPGTNVKSTVATPKKNKYGI